MPRCRDVGFFFLSEKKLHFSRAVQLDIRFKV